MARMAKAKLKSFQKQLQDRLAELTAEMEEVTKNFPDENQDHFADPTDQAVSELDRARFFRIKDRERKLLRKIEKALVRIKEGTYGECEMCGTDIELPRLEARPMADLCIDCATEAEGEKRKVERFKNSPASIQSFQ